MTEITPANESAEPAVPQYDSIGEMLKHQDFKTLLSKLIQYQNDEADLEVLTIAVPGAPISELNKLLFSLPNYALKKITPEEEEAGQKPSKELCEGVLEVVDQILKMGADPNLTHANGVTSFHTACQINNPAIAQALLDNPYTVYNIEQDIKESRKADLNKGDGQGKRGFMYAVLADATDTMEFLALERGYDINERVFLLDNRTAFHYACGLEKEVVIDKLMELGADPTVLDNFAEMPEQRVPAFDPEIHMEDEFSQEELAKWDELYEKVGNYRKKYQQTKSKPKNIF